MVETVSTDFDQEDLAELVREAMGVIGKTQKAPYIQENVDLSNKEAVEAADRKRFAFVNGIVRRVEKRQVYTREMNFQDKIDAVLTHPLIGLGVFALVMFLVFDISQATLGPWIADLLVGWIEVFQGWVAEQVTGAAPILQSLLVDGIIGGVGAGLASCPW